MTVDYRYDDGVNARKKLLLVTEAWRPEVGGVQRYLEGLMTYLAEWERTVVAPAAARAEQGRDEANVNVVRRHFYRFFVRPRWFFLYKFVQRLVLQREIKVLLCGKALFEGRLALKIKTKWHIPYVVFTYAMEIETWLAQGRRKQLSRVLMGASQVFYLNDHMRRELVGLGVAQEHLTYLPPAVNEYFLEKDAVYHELKDRFGLPDQYVFVAARLVARKGVDIVLEAFAQLDQTRWGDLGLVIMGDGPELARLQMMAEALLLNTSDGIGRVFFVGAVNDEELRALYAGATLFALAPRELAGDMEGFGIVFLEAAAQYLPVVATRTGGVTEAVEHNVAGILVSPDDAAAFSGAITKLLEDPELARRYGQAGRRRVERDFMWSAQVKKLDSVLSTIVNQ